MMMDPVMDRRMLTSVCGRHYHFFVMGSIDSEPKRSESRATGQVESHGLILLGSRLHVPLIGKDRNRI